MKKTLLILFVLFYVNGFSQETYIYTPEGKTYLTYELSKILLHAKDLSPGVIQGLRANQLLDEIALHYDFRELEEMEWMDVNIKPGKIASTENLKKLLNELNRDSLVMMAYPYMRTEDGTLLGILNWINFKLKANDDLKNHEKLFTSLGIILTDSSKMISKAYHGKILYGDPINLVNKLHESGLFEYVELDYMMEFELYQLPNPSDPFLYQQWAITQMSVNNAWNLSRGENIKIAVLDTGVDIIHPDLIGNLYNNGYDATGTRNDASPRANDYHGTMVSGIATMVANDVGGAGIAYNAKLIPIRVSKGGKFTNSWISSGINVAYIQGADIINMSFGGGSPSYLINNSINSAAANGRNGKGSIFFAASGNDEGNVVYPASLANVIAVGATNIEDERISWSNHGSNLSLVAPGNSIFTTDISGTNGQCPTDYWWCEGNDYWRRFEGTSAASPAAAAVMALILSINPNLTRVQATAIIESTCDKVGSYSYNQTAPNGTKSTEMGYGRVNARNAVVAAFQSSQPITGPTILCSSNTNYTLVGAPQNASINWSFSPSNRVVTSSGTGTTATLRGTSCTNIGNGRLTFSINQPGMTWQVYKDIIVNGPDYSDVTLDIFTSAGEPVPKYGGSWQLCQDTHYHIYLVNNSGCSTSNYSWILPQGWTKNWDNQNMVSIYTGSSWGGNFVVKAQTCCTNCGSGITIHSSYLSSSSCYPGLFMIYPNPADSYVYIDFDKDKSDGRGINQKTEYNLILTDNMGVMKYADKIYEFPHRINTSNLSNGVYIIRVVYEEKTYSTRLVIDN
jgi:subtilisin family serine protease